MKLLEKHFIGTKNSQGLLTLCKYSSIFIKYIFCLWLYAKLDTKIVE